ncbi:hypothetical protein HELRODRAFT_175949 [Helobdella robusta]|uniref:THAP-type domain-containing protein n=1 Tax=Helobdella robusta TaxID=6412 RepID=T1F9Y3_HELRO|nr:hypothetical protein HELRODRAFT_175949 [Helobdella robusta]ESO00508.1 hypothetical protein HELRODRAFT_175949 [Helobdella robusta]
MNHSLLQMMRSDTVPFLTSFFFTDSLYIPREDYKEFVELCRLVLDYPMQTDGKYHYRVPGAYHTNGLMARWMAKVIYCLRMHLFRNEFKLTATETKSLTEFCLFATHIYVPAWMLFPILSDASVKYLQLLGKIEQYFEINKNVAKKIKKSFSNTQYLDVELVMMRPQILESASIDILKFCSKWMKANSRQDFEPTKYSKVCSLHFQTNDFTHESIDSNQRRKKARSNKNVKHLKPKAVPSIFQNAPKYLSTSKSERPTRLATSNSDSILKLTD